MEFDYTVTTTKTFDAAVESVQEQIGKAGMRVLYVHDVQKTLGEKGIAREPFKIIEFCNAKFANEFLSIDVKIGLCMPCKINVYVKDGQIYISGMRPIVLPQFFPDAALGERPKEIDRIVLRIIDSAK
ncbi:MAG: hypothetical protein A2W52_02490 [Candidatus Taylorbacteria bacterium RIFCSPHIGHO2_02_49_25]|uniref:DUF302 domain-containing protein n=1 Tax=Candidatus Taylorbacteria bacterium RIFCSPHIGHO2_02_49_25 TaxID=1802305 RepID=A0A1G2MD64_9BACT|nr:MAG: hypothetical protein UY62_C0001G0006 [Parcubacteria group bacterium GW2011_GWF2_50_9]OHA19264.1 MAG: hypothetical protein A2759_03140 [Candidatus Taylorbacteria bacterium RIFCSPHIGHO2_01_FULL_49_60]OHA21850.1 MAG: hypothetical protein A2W52_02490 [Candidatus Taylorbacteria bacterium RIFCSPHIGHO2_02_49_25]OHA35576.1 MAG: hypothetical protein A2W65_00770 [Candidatus Taylorbacteria bacterium RIFCSPLOWO2_02_50_13]OHA36865.1 MAG: hypothetical protein A3B27_01025 [Candidatus Taylorbacteria ba